MSGATGQFDTVVMVDWSARATPSPAKPSADAIWVAVASGRGLAETTYLRTRAAAAEWLADLLRRELAAGRRVLAGFDFPFGYPAGFARLVTGRDEALAVWDWLSREIRDDPDNANTRFEVAARLNARFPGLGPFWGCPDAVRLPDLPAKGSARHGHGLAERRAVEARVPRAQPVWKLYTTGSVGSQALLGLPRLQALREEFGPRLSVWPFEPPTGQIVLAEIYPSMLATAVAAATGPSDIKDAVQVRVMAEAFARMPSETLRAAFEAAPAAVAEEGWILGVGAEAALARAAGYGPDGRLPDDCFALPPGVDWTPVDEALARLRGAVTVIVGTETVPVAAAAGRVLAANIFAARANPPAANTAVDGYGFAHAAAALEMPIAPGRAAAGAPSLAPVPAGTALRVLTGAVLPSGVDTVVLDEDSEVVDGRVRLAALPKRGSNTRQAGEDLAAGALALAAGRVLTVADLALASAVGLGALPVHRQLRVAVLSTGDELQDPEGDLLAEAGRTYDANRPMLLSAVQRWGHAPHDRGIARDSRDEMRAAFDGAAAVADVLICSGGASAGDEDHVSALLRDEGHVAAWRIALKPGRPLALGQWRGMPVFGLPGNPVAALVCACLFARPALSAMAGAGWRVPQGFEVPAAFEKRKKPGRREYLRARIRDGQAEVFGSEGSGRISGLSWAEGLVELGDGAGHVRPGDTVRYYPWQSFGL